MRRTTWDFLSWCTSDTKASIRNVSTGRAKPVYLLQPAGAAPIEEPAYEGYEVFGGIDAYTGLGRRSVPRDEQEGLTENGFRALGVALERGRLLRTSDGSIYSVFHGEGRRISALGVPVKDFPGTWQVPIPIFGKSANQMVKEGTAKVVPVAEVMEVRYPLKFSFDSKARYEDLPAARIDPTPGYS